MKQIFQMYKDAQKLFISRTTQKKSVCVLIFRAHRQLLPTICRKLHYKLQHCIYIPVHAIYVCVCQTFGATMHKPNHPPPYITKENFQPSSAGSTSGPHEMPFFTRKDDPIFIMQEYMAKLYVVDSGVFYEHKRMRSVLQSAAYKWG